MAEQVRPQKPTGTLQQRIEQLRKEFPTIDFDSLPPPSNDLTYHELLEEWVGSLEKLHAYIKNGHSEEGLWFKTEAA